MATLVAALLAARPVALKTSLADLVGDGADAVPKSVRDASANLVPVLVWSAADDAEAVAAANALRAAIPRDALEPDGEANPVAALAADRYGLASLADVRRLATPDGRTKIARSAIRRFVASPVPPLFPPAEDPFALADGFVRSAWTDRANWSLRDGLPCATDGTGQSFFILLLRLRPSTVASADAQVAFRETLDAAIATTAAAFPGVRVAACGVPLHTAITAARCRREINALSAFSVLFIAVLAVFAFRGVRWIPLLAASLAVATLAGAAALLALFDEIHVMTVVFGTTVLGLVIDYSFHWLLAETRQGFGRNLAVSWLTTEISLLPLMFASLPVLRQSAVFLGVALAAALLYVVTGYPKGDAGLAARPASRACGGLRRLFARLPRALALALGAAASAGALVGLCRVRFGTDLTALYRPPAELASTERRFAELSDSAEADRGFLVFDRATIAADVAKLHAEQGARLAAALGLNAAPQPPPPGLIPEAALTAVRRPEGELPPGVRFLRPCAVLEDTLARWTQDARRRLAFALVLMFAALVAFCRRRAVEMLVPSLLAIASVAALLGLLGEKVNLFHILAGFLLAGMSIDYTVFLHLGGRAAFKPALCSLLTSMAGFGALAFVSFPVVRSFGLVLGVGLPVGFLVSLATSRSPSPVPHSPFPVPRPPSAPPTELAASPWGLEILWWAYRLAGLRALRAGAAGVALGAWTCSARVRRATRPRRLLNFARALADKLVVMADGRDLPRVVADGSPDAAAFAADVRSGRGVFVLSSHCGAIETLAALADCDRTFHAWMDFDRTSVFSRFYLRHAKRERVVIHPVSEIGMETAFLAGEALDRGDCLVMAGDRGRGAFRFARAMGHPVYFAACVWTGRGYRAVIRRLPDGTEEMETAYRAARDALATTFPDQLYDFALAARTTMTAVSTSKSPTASRAVKASPNAKTPMATAVSGSRAPRMAVGVAPRSREL